MNKLIKAPVVVGAAIGILIVAGAKLLADKNPTVVAKVGDTAVAMKNTVRTWFSKLNTKTVESAPKAHTIKDVV